MLSHYRTGMLAALAALALNIAFFAAVASPAMTAPLA